MTTKQLTPTQDGIVEALSALVTNATEEDRNTIELALSAYAAEHATEWRTAEPLLRGLLNAMAYEVCDRATLRRVGA